MMKKNYLTPEVQTCEACPAASVLLESNVEIYGDGGEI